MPLTSKDHYYTLLTWFNSGLPAWPWETCPSNLGLMAYNASFTITDNTTLILLHGAKAMVNDALYAIRPRLLGQVSQGQAGRPAVKSGQ